ncbi:hypothetical protein J6590_058010 [Homalodisca vitripennis]|nr:hypothetical protein J6590_058010 [Homalodisca vitripennis]
MDKDLSDAGDIQVDSGNDLQNGAVGGRSEISKSVENLSTDHRIKKKAKRGVVRQLSKDATPNSHNVVSARRSWKNTRRPRNGRGRGLPKKVVWAPYWENVLSYLRKKGDKNILHLRFEDMKKDLPSIIKKTAGFLGKPLSDQQVDVLLKHLSFENMKSNDAVNMENLKGHYEILTGNKVNDHIMRDGQAGGWREKLSPDWVRRFDEWTERKLQGTGISLSDE